MVLPQTLLECPVRADLELHGAGLLWTANLEDRADQSHPFWNLDVRGVAICCKQATVQSPASAPTPNGRMNLHALPPCRLACVSREGARGWAVRRPVTKHGAPKSPPVGARAQGVKSSSSHESEHRMARKPCKSPAESEHLALKRSVEVFLGL